MWTKPPGTKGLSFVLSELKKAQIKGMFKGQFTKTSAQPSYLTKGLGALGKRLKENVQTKLDIEQKTIELMKAIKQYKTEILERMMKEQGFNTEES